VNAEPLFCSCKAFKKTFEIFEINDKTSIVSVSWDPPHGKLIGQFLYCVLRQFVTSGSTRKACRLFVIPSVLQGTRWWNMKKMRWIQTFRMCRCICLFVSYLTAHQHCLGGRCNNSNIGLLSTSIISSIMLLHYFIELCNILC